MNRKLGVRWTIGDVSPRGFEALRLSLFGALKVFGPEAAYVVYVNSMPVDRARERTGPSPGRVQWRAAPREMAPALRGVVDAGMAQGVAWKLSPLRAFPERYELALDNDVILWDLPEGMACWLSGGPDERLLAEDVVAAHGAFAELCGREPRNSGIRGVPPGFSLAEAFRRVLEAVPAPLTSELDEQGLQVAALSLDGAPRVVSTADVAICSPFWPHQWDLGRCGAHFVGLNARDLPWRYYDRPATEVRIEHWEHHRAELYRRVGLSPDPGRNRLPSTHSSSAWAAGAPSGGT
ncbi:MAG TPA: hypothetical protein VLI41_05655 [Phenylobacterium sp.]|uniref:hypothetical protein n=1 Tax=Phenylobacterium sp. TaxID=1871053 RepID=UPI002C9B2E10|nr:hypothetical protein [Phenylobacterium sp.]HSV02673.1 hypothetical protein [Phenylobacterium sp.]